MKDHRGDRPRRVSWQRLAGVSCAAGLVLGVGSAAAAGASARAATTGCQPQAGAVVRTLRLSAPAHTVSAHVGDTINVIADFKGEQVGVPRAFGQGDHAVCRISWHRGSGSEASAKFRALAAGKVTFGSVASKDGHAPLIVGYAKIESSP